MEEIDHLLEEGEVESSGVFTLDTAKALEKLAAFQFADRSFWVLKLVQAGVSLGASAMFVRLQKSEAQITFESVDSEFPEMPKFFSRVAREPVRGWQHFKRALWSLAVAGRKVECSWPGEDFAWSWEGEWIRRPAVRGKNLVVRVGGQGARWNADLLTTLSQRAFLCPVPLVVDGRPMQGLQGCPEHGLSPTSFPIYSDLNDDPDLAELTFPETTFEPVESSRGLMRRVRSVPRVGGRLSLGCLVSVHFRSGATGWTARPTPSRIYWISDGVVLESEEIPVGTGSVSCGVYLSATGLRVDLSSFRLLESGLRDERRRAAWRLVHLLARHADVPRGALEDAAQSKPTSASLLALGGGAALAVFVPPLGILLAAGGLGALLCSGGLGDQVIRRLELDLRDLKSALKRLAAQS